MRNGNEAHAATADAVTIAENLCPVIENVWVNAEYKYLEVSAPPIALAVLPGQFFHLRCPAVGLDQPFLRRPMSIYRIDRSNGRIAFLYKPQGAGTRGLASLEAGDVLDAFGPVGNGFSLPKRGGHLLIAGRGVGLATLAPLAAHAHECDVRVSAILSARSADLLMSEDLLRSAGATVITVTDEEATSDVEAVDMRVRDIHARMPIGAFATCGSNRLFLLLQRLGREFGIPGQVALEQHMGCALGMCYACVKPFRKSHDSDVLTYRRVCWEGPVFDLQEAVAW
jgi:dihydroorotate dehydrogenase electron transfer subunit